MMRFAWAAVVLMVGCRSAGPAGAELTHEQCADLVRRVHRLQSEDTGGLRLALNVGLESDIEGCIQKGTRRGYDCVLQAETAKDLESCDALMK